MPSGEVPPGVSIFPLFSPSPLVQFVGWTFHWVPLPMSPPALQPDSACSPAQKSLELWKNCLPKLQSMALLAAQLLMAQQ